MEPAPVQARPEPICALVVDDEASARRRLADLLDRDRDIGRVLMAENGVEAVAQINEAKPDIVFLDVQMPVVDGFGVIGAVGAENMPLTVFVTAYDRFALQAFEADAIDYLLKPFSDERYAMTMQRVKTRLHDLHLRHFENAGAFGPELLKLVAQRSRPGEIWDWIVVKTGDTTRLIMTEEIDWIEAAGVYVTVHAKGKEYLYRGGLAAVASRLDPFHFVRIHRSSIVNLNSVASLERRSHGEFEVILNTGAKLRMSRSYRAEFEAMLGQPL
jgi:two-component system LytT family response regulator